MTDGRSSDGQRPQRGETRTEHDSLGEIQVPAESLWGAQTQRAVENFPISGDRVDPALIWAIAAIKAAAAATNAELGVIEQPVADAIASSTQEIRDGLHDREFPVDVFQTGSGTSTNMNVNEVVAHLASQRLGAEVHPNDHVNASQSSNDVIPSAIKVATIRGIRSDLVPALEHLAASLRRRQDSFAEVVKCGRTHLMDAVPVTLGQEFGGYATSMELGVDRLRDVLPRLSSLALGGTAVGTGLNAPDGFATGAISRLATDLGFEVVEAADHFEAQGGQDALVEASGSFRVVAVSLNKLATDLRWMGSGPSTGLGEIHLPDLQPGSSIMPGKVNPVLPEAVHQVVAQVIGNDAAVAFSGSAGAFELNVMLPVMARNVLESIRLLANVARLLADRCIDGIAADEAVCRRYADSTPSLVTALVPIIGYEAAAAVAHRAVSEGRTIREIVEQDHDLSNEVLDDALDPLAMTRGGVRTSR